jgi:hypothetical protein
MTRYAFALSALVGATLGLLLTFAPSAHAVPTGTTCSASGCYTNEVGDLRIDPSANTTVVQEEVCFITTTVTSVTALFGAKEVAARNKGTTTVNLSFDADNPTSVGGGWPLDAGDMQSFPVGSNIPIKGVASTSNQTSPACVEFLKLK